MITNCFEFNLQKTLLKVIKNNRNILISFVTAGDETLYFEYEPQTKKHSVK